MIYTIKKFKEKEKRNLLILIITDYINEFRKEKIKVKDRKKENDVGNRKEKIWE